MRDGNDPNAIGLDLIDDTEWKPPHFDTAKIILFWPPDARMLFDFGESLFYNECFPDETAASFVIQPDWMNSFPASR